MKTLFSLMAEYETANIPLERCCHLFGLGPDEASKRAIRHRLPVPAFRAGSQKSPWIIAADVLASYLDNQKAAAAEEWGRLKRVVSA